MAIVTHYAIPCPESLYQGFETLVHNLEQGVREPQNRLLIAVANDYTDVVVSVMVLGNSHMMEPGSMARRILEQVAAAIRGAAHTLVRQILGKMSNAELAPLSAQIRGRQLQVGERIYISFPVPAHIAASYRKSFAAIRAGDVSVRHEFMEAMLEFSDLATHYFYDESIRPLKLGFVARKLADVGGVAIRKASHSAIRALIPRLDQQELLAFADYLDPLFIDVEA